MGTKKSERIFWTLLSPAQPSYTALTGPETAICERPRAGDRKSDQFCHHSIPPNSPLTRRLGAKSQKSTAPFGYKIGSERADYYVSTFFTIRQVTCGEVSYIILADR